MSGPDLVAVFLRWIWWRAALHKGWWLVTSVYLVVDAGLSPSQLVLIGAAQAATALVFEIPAGVVADTISRKWALVLSHLLMGTAMVATGLVTDFGPLVATQMLWGLSWTLASGADVAWITDELAPCAQDRNPRAGIPVARKSKGPKARPLRGRDESVGISVVLVRAGRAQLTGAAAGIVGLGALASVTQRGTTMILAGAAMLALGLYVVVRFREQRFVRAPARRWSASWSILVRGSILVRRSRAILVLFAATFLVTGAAGAFGRMQPRRLVDLGLPTDPVAWFTVLGLLTVLVGAAAFRAVEPHVDTAGAAVRAYAVACAAGAVGLVVLAGAPEEVSASAAVLLVAGVTVPLTRTLGTILVNQQTVGEIRATVHSFLALAEYLGVIACGLFAAAVARLAGLTAALVACAALFAIAILLVRREVEPGSARESRGDMTSDALATDG